MWGFSDQEGTWKGCPNPLWSHQLRLMDSHLPALALDTATSSRGEGRQRSNRHGQPSVASLPRIQPGAAPRTYLPAVRPPPSPSIQPLQTASPETPPPPAKAVAQASGLQDGGGWGWRVTLGGVKAVGFQFSVGGGGMWSVLLMAGLQPSTTHCGAWTIMAPRINQPSTHTHTRETHCHGSNSDSAAYYIMPFLINAYFNI